MMAGRKYPLITNQIYHIFNRGIDHKLTFLDKRDYFRAINSMIYYQHSNLPFKYAKLLSISLDERNKIWTNLIKSNDKYVNLISYCFMPNHFHFLVEQLEDEGISKFLSNFSNSYTRYFNTKNKRNGFLFEGRFKSVRIETNDQLIHVSRYIHLNPSTSYIVKKIEDLDDYRYSSFPEYIGKELSFQFCNKERIISNFSNKNSYRDFVFDNADYQRDLDKIKHLTLESD